MSSATQHGERNYSHFNVGGEARVHAGDHIVNQTIHQTVLPQSEVLKTLKPAFRFVQVFDFATRVERAIEELVGRFNNRSGGDLEELTCSTIIDVKEIVDAREWLEVAPFEDASAETTHIDLGDLPQRSADCHGKAKHLLYLLKELRASEQQEIDAGAKFATEVARLNKRLHGLPRSEQFERSKIFVGLANMWVHAARQTVQSGQAQTDYWVSGEVQTDFGEYLAGLRMSVGRLAEELVLRFWSERASKSEFGHRDTDHDQCVDLVRSVASWPIRECNDKAKVIIDQLAFEQMKERQALADAWPSTYMWALRDNLCGLRTWFTKGEGIYWIAGKAGSGKSTLMKFLSSATETRKLLDQWCCGQDLVVLNFYFWFAGSNLQNSTLGLLRSILHQILSERPALIRVAFPDISNRKAGIDQTRTVKQLFAAFECIASHKGESGNMKFCIFVDGLDEYSGNHGGLVDLLWSLARSENIKLCVASRPWNAFQIAYEDKPHLRLEDLSGPDIRCFVSDKIYLFGTKANIIDYLDLREGVTARSETVSQYKRNEERDTLVELIVQKAEGVFLWVYLVVKSVLSELAEGDSFQMMQFRVEEFPQDLDKFFSSILDRVDHVYRHQTNQHLKLALLYTEDEESQAMSSWLDFWLISTNPTGLKPGAAYELTLDQSMQHTMRYDLQRSLSSSCKDLLLLPRQSGLATQVTWLHRSVYDYLKDQGTTNVIDKNVPESFKNGEALQDMWLLRCRVLHWYGSDANAKADRLFTIAFSRKHSMSEAYAATYDQALLAISSHPTGESESRPIGFRNEAGITALSKLVAFGHTSYMSHVLGTHGLPGNRNWSFGSSDMEIGEIILACIGESPFRPFRICEADVVLVDPILHIFRGRDCMLRDPCSSSCGITLRQIFWRKWALEASSFNQAELSHAWEVTKLVLRYTADFDWHFCTVPDPPDPELDHTHTFISVRTILKKTVPKRLWSRVRVWPEERIPEEGIPEERGIRSRMFTFIKRNKSVAPLIVTSG